MLRARLRPLFGPWDISFLTALLIFLACYLIGGKAVVVLAIDCIFLVPLTIIEAVRGARYVMRNLMWSLRNRLILVYALFGVLPVTLLFAIFGIISWLFFSELAVSTAQGALQGRLNAMESAVETINRMSDGARRDALPEIQHSFAYSFPGVAIYYSDDHGSRKIPDTAPDLNVPDKWGNVHGLLVFQRHFYAWAHYRALNRQITVMAPLTDEMIANLVPHLGVIELSVEDNGGNSDPDPKIKSTVGEHRLPDPVSRFDLPVTMVAPEPHMHLEKPDASDDNIELFVFSRPSAVLSAVFNSSDVVRGALAIAVAAIAIFFLIVELAAVVLGVSLSSRITRAVDQLYRGTQLVISGDFSHRISTRSRDQLGALANSFNQMTGHLERLLAAEKERERLQAELEIAREVQAQLYPRGNPPEGRLRLYARCDPARMVSGDYYDYQSIGNQHLAFAIGDVAGKGISAALLMATIQSALRAQLSRSLPESISECSLAPEIDSADLVSKLNQQVWAHTSPEKYATFFFGIYDGRNRTLTYTNAGHLPPLLLRNGAVAPLDTNGMVIGAFNQAKYDSSCITLEPGDLLVCYTDGITEASNAYDEMFGEERMIELLQKHSGAPEAELARVIFDAVRGWSNSAEQFDDMTLLLARLQEQPV